MQTILLEESGWNLWEYLGQHYGTELMQFAENIVAALIVFCIGWSTPSDPEPQGRRDRGEIRDFDCQRISADSGRIAGSGNSGDRICLYFRAAGRFYVGSRAGTAGKSGQFCGRHDDPAAAYISGRRLHLQWNV